VAEVISGVGSLTFTRNCWACRINKEALGGKTDKRTKMWCCAGCSQGKNMEWQKGTPPSEGWWPTKHFLNSNWGAYRWWDGERWSWPAFAHEVAEKAAHWAGKKEKEDANVLWAERPADWPERSLT
jgi:hypothetical protein